MSKIPEIKDNKLNEANKAKLEYLLWSLVFIIPIILRIILFFSTREDLFLWIRAAGDEAEHHKWALQIASGNLLRESAFFTTPLYAYFLAAIYYFINDDLLTVRCANLILFCLTICFISLSSKRLFKFPFSLIPPFFMGISFPPLFYESFAEKTSLVLFLSTFSFYSLIRAMKTFSKKFMILSGISCGLTLLAHATLLPLILCVILSILILKRHSLKTTIVPIILFSASCLIGVLPATLHNYITSDDFVLIAWNGGQSFHTANHLHNKSGLYHPPSFITKPELTYEELDYKKEAEKRNMRSMKPSELSRYWFRQGWKDILTDPSLALNRYLKRLLWSFHNVELADTRHPDFYNNRFYSFYEYLPGLGVISALGILGIYFSKTMPEFLFMRLFVISFPLFMASFFIYGRYRLPIIIPLLLLGTVTIECLYTRLLKKQFFLPAAQLCIIFFMGMLFYGNVKEHIETYDETREIKNASAGYGIEALRLEKIGKLDEALKLYRNILEINPSISETYYNMALVLLKQGKRQEALKKFIEATEVNPNLSDAYNNIGNIHAMNRDYEKAIKNYEKAIFSNPDNPSNYNNLGAMYMILGHKENAINNFKRAIELNPNYESPKKNLQKILGSNLEKNLDE
jgi:tetratricopeptide (TPR) repeat protein